MAKKYTAIDMRLAAEDLTIEGLNWMADRGTLADAAEMLRQAADTRERIEKEIKLLKDLLVPTCHNCGHRCAFRNGKKHCEKHIGDGSEVFLVDKIKFLKELINV